MDEFALDAIVGDHYDIPYEIQCAVVSVHLKIGGFSLAIHPHNFTGDS